MSTRLSRRFRPVNMNGCVLYLPFWAYGYETYDRITMTDQSGARNHATRGALVAASPVPGPNQVGWFFDGSSSYMNVVDANSLDVQTYTALVWVYPTLLTAQRVIINKWITGSNATFLWDFASASLRVILSTDGTANALIQTANSTTATNAWVNHAMVYNATAQTVVFYKNGAVWPSTVTAGAVPASIKSGTSPVRIGATTGGVFQGNIGEVLLSSRAFALEEMRSYYELSRPKYGV